MKYYFVLLLLFALFSCENEDPINPVEEPVIADFIIGATGGWGGGYAFRIVDGQLQRSVERSFLGGPETIANDTDFSEYTDEDVVVLQEVMADFPAEAFAQTPVKFDCEEQAWDGQCTYIVLKFDDETVRYWTRSEFDQDTEVTDYLDRVTEVMYMLYE